MVKIQMIMPISLSFQLIQQDIKFEEQSLRWSSNGKILFLGILRGG
jgi:hypothetical protein